VVEVEADRLLAANIGAQLPADPLVAAWYRRAPVSMPAGSPAPAQPVSSIPMPIGAATNGISRRVAPILVLIAQLPFIMAIASPTSWANFPAAAHCYGRAYPPVYGEGKSRAKGGSAGRAVPSVRTSTPQALRRRPGGNLGTRGKAELSEDIADVLIHRALGDDQAKRNLTVSEAASD